jgi:hypothetical protein
MNEAQRIRATDTAIRIAPGIAAAKFRQDKEGALTLLHDYQLEMRSWGLSPADAWSCLTAALLCWLEEAVQELADISGITPDVVLQDMGLRSLKAGT